MGVSGGEEGARFGPSMMPGGNKEAYQVVQPMFEAIAAKVDGEPCVTYIGPGAAGHFVKMVHNGIEYGLMQLIAETYDVLKTGLGLDNAAIGEVFAQWNEGRLQSFLLDITKDIFAFKAPEPTTCCSMISRTRPARKAPANGPRRLPWTWRRRSRPSTRPWRCATCQSTKPCASSWPACRPRRRALAGRQEKLSGAAGQAFYFSMVITYAQGMHLLGKASEDTSTS